MTIDQLLTRLSTYQGALIIYFALLPVLAFGLSFMHSVYGGRRPPWNGLYSLLMYLVSLPTAFVVAVTGYMVIFDMVGLGALPFVRSYVPLISFVLTALLIKRAVDFYYLPGLLNPLGQLLLMVLCMSGGLYLYHTELFLIFGNALLTGGAAALLAFLIIRGILGSIFGHRE